VNKSELSKWTFNRKLIRSKIETFRSPDSSSLFIEKSVKLLGNDGILAFVVPKSLSYVISWKDIRQFILDNCKITDDELSFLEQLMEFY